MPFGPVEPGGRNLNVDILRGFALLGILTMNIGVFALPGAAMFNPRVAGGFEGLDRLIWWISHLFFSMKFMTIFSMLFGAGLILMFTRAEDKNARLGPVYYRRILWLFVIGMIHAYFIWYGDILVSYALTGVLIFLFRRLKPRTLLILGVGILAFGLVAQYGSGALFKFIKGQADLAVEIKARGEILTMEQSGMLEAWQEMKKGFAPEPERLEEEIAAMRGSYWQTVSHRAIEVVGMQTYAFLTMIFWRTFGVMLLGMALFKWGVFTGMRSRAFYWKCVIVGYVVGLSGSWYGGSLLEQNKFDFIYMFMGGMTCDWFATVFTALGHTGVVMLICQAGGLARLRSLLAAVGQTALSNYLFQSLICTAIFNGWGLGLFASFNRSTLILFVLGVWAIQLPLSGWWVKRFRFGPAEWLWRSLTYWKVQPMRR